MEDLDRNYKHVSATSRNEAIAHCLCTEHGKMRSCVYACAGSKGCMRVCGKIAWMDGWMCVWCCVLFGSNPCTHDSKQKTKKKKMSLPGLLREPVAPTVNTAITNTTTTATIESQTPSTRPKTAKKLKRTKSLFVLRVKDGGSAQSQRAGRARKEEGR
jgi:hypothetical protein